jgi:hypothetical protein
VKSSARDAELTSENGEREIIPKQLRKDEKLIGL